MKLDPNDRSARVIQALERALAEADEDGDYKAVIEITDKLKALGALAVADGLCPTCGHSSEVDEEIADLIRQLEARG